VSAAAVVTNRRTGAEVTMRRLVPAASLITALLRENALHAELAGFYHAVMPATGPNSPFRFLLST
jgi:hypothetical protein